MRRDAEDNEEDGHGVERGRVLGQSGAKCVPRFHLLPRQEALAEAREEASAQGLK